MAEIKRFSNKGTIDNGTADTNLSLSDILISQHITGDNSDYKLPLAQVQAIPYGVCDSASADDKTVTFSNFPDSFTAQVGTKILVKFTNKNTKGSVSAGTYPTLTAGGVTKPIAAQGKTIGTGAIVAGQIVELVLTPDFWNIDQQIREVGSSYTIMTNGDNIYTASQVNGALVYRPYFRKYKANYLSGNYNTYLTVPITLTDKSQYIYAKLILRVRSSIREIHLYTNDGILSVKGVIINDVGFISEAKWSPSEQKLYIKILNYAGTPTFYLEKSNDSVDDFAVGTITHSTTAYTLPSDVINV